MCGRRRASATPTPWTPSWTRPGTSCATVDPQERPGGLVDPRALATGCRWTSTSAASSTPFLHLLYARFFTKVHPRPGPDRLRPSRSRALPERRAQVHQRRQGKMSKSLGNGVGSRRAAGQVRRGRRAPDHGLRLPAGGRRRLGRCLPVGLREVPGRAPGASSQDVASVRRAWTPRQGTRPCARSPTRTVHEAAHLLESRQASTWSSPSVMELVNATRKAIDSGCGPEDPAVREAAETSSRILLSLVAPYTAEDMWEARWATRRPCAPGRAGQRSTKRCWWRTPSPPSSRSRARSAAAWRSRPTSARRTCEAAALADPAVQKAIDGRRGPQGDRAGPQAGQHRRLTGRAGQRAAAAG